MARLTGHGLDLGGGEALDACAGAKATQVDFQTAHRWAQFGEVLVHLDHAATQGGLALDQHDLAAGLCRLYGSRDPGDAAADDKDASTRRPGAR
jgi:hypothetical protein